MSIEVRDLTKLYGEQKAIDAVSFRVGKSEIVGFLGPNGAGKSTTMKIITGYLQPDKGDATVCGISVKDQPLEIKKKIGYLPEGNPLYNDMYVKEYLDFVEDVHRIKNKKLDRAAQAKHPPRTTAIMSNVSSRHIAGNQRLAGVVRANRCMKHSAATARPYFGEVAGARSR